MKLLIVHLSDIHLRGGENPVLAKFPPIVKALQNEEVALDGVVVVVSGDIAYSGSTAEYKIAAEQLVFLQKGLAEKTKVEDVRFVFVPGNHDCDFGKAGNERETIITAIRKGANAPVDSGIIELCCKVQEDFFRFRDAFPTAAPQRSQGRLYWEYIWEKGEIKVLFRCYNTAWLSQLREQQGGLYFPIEFVVDQDPGTKSDYCVSVFHHPYNWMPAATHRRFRDHIEKTSDLILTGHEHEPDHYQKYSFQVEVNEYLEGAVLQESDNPDRAGFHAICVDLVAQRQRVRSFSWNHEMFVPTQQAGVGWTQYKRGSRGGKRDFELTDEYARWLEEPGAAFDHPTKHDDLTLSDFFVFPNLKEFKINDQDDFVYGSMIEAVTF
jgi:3',5'-cyclic AMP phosphodiesterase CpdA